MLVRLLLTTALLTAATSSLLAQDTPATPFEARTFQGENDRVLPYRFLAPLNVQPDQKYPLVIFLHGAGERGDDNFVQLKHVAGELASEEMRQRYPAFVIAPQCPKDGWWGGNLSPRRLSQTPRPDSSIDLVLKLIDQLQRELPVDASRIYITGLSMGGYGTWEAIKQQPGRFAAAAPICGGGDPASAEKFAHVPIWVFHGDQDRAVPVQLSRDMVHALKGAGGNPIYTEYPGVDHDSWSQTAKNRLFWDWMFAQQLSKQ